MLVDSNHMRSNAHHYIVLLILLVITIVLTTANMHSAVNLVFFLVCMILLLINRELLYLIYIITLPTNGFISTEYNIYGIFHVSYIIHMFAFIAIFLEWMAITSENRKTKINLPIIQKYASGFLIFVFLFIVFTEYRQYYLGFSDISTQLLITRTIKYCMMFLPMLFLIKLCYIEYYKNIVWRGFIISVGLIALSMIFSEQIHQLGIATQDTHRIDEAGFRGGYIRRAGIFRSLGDVNSAAGFLVIGFAFILYIGKLYIHRVLEVILLLLIIIALIASGSRAAFLSISFVIIYYFLNSDININEKILQGVFLMIIILFFIFQDLLNPVIDRFGAIRIGEDHLDRNYQYGRVGGWIFYLNYILSHPDVCIVGARKSIYAGIGHSYERVAHNYFIQLWYIWGIFPLLLFIGLISKYIKYVLHSNMKYALIALLIPFVITLFFVSDTGVFLGFVTAIAALPNEY
jgi:hypothetical protein